MTTALPSLVADPSLRTNHSPPPSALPTSNLPTHDPEHSAANTINNTNTRTSHSSHLSVTAPSIPWGPSHPCFPHPNPHVPLSSPHSTTTRIIRIPRDWMIAGDLAPQYSNTYPEILEPWVSEHDFRTLLARVNEGLLETFRVDGWRAWADMIAGVATGWLWEDFGGEKVRVKKGVRGVEAWIEEWNRRGGREIDGVRCVSLRRTGYLSLDIQIPDPKVRVVESEEPETEQQPDTATTTAPSTVRGHGY